MWPYSKCMTTCVCVCVNACVRECLDVTVCLCRLIVTLSVRWVQGPVAFQVQLERRVSGSANGSPCTQTRGCLPIQTCWGSQTPGRMETYEKKINTLVNKGWLSYKVKGLMVTPTNLLWTCDTRKHWEDHIVWGNLKRYCTESHDCESGCLMCISNTSSLGIFSKVKTTSLQS